MSNRTVWSESVLGAFWIPKDAKFLHADNEDSEHTARKRRVIRLEHMQEGTFYHGAARFMLMLNNWWEYATC